MEDGFLAALQGGMSVETWKQHVHKHTHAKTDEVQFL